MNSLNSDKRVHGILIQLEEGKYKSATPTPLYRVSLLTRKSVSQKALATYVALARCYDGFIYDDLRVDICQDL
jgi:hypothetical protein